MAGRVFDDNGGTWSSTSTEFRLTFATQGSGQSSGDYAIKALGFVVIDQFGGTAQIRLAPAVVSGVAITQAFDWLKAQNFSRLSIAYFERGWQFTLAGSLETAAAQIAEAVVRAARTRLEPVLWQPTDRSQVLEHVTLKAMMREWREIVTTGATVDPVDLASRSLGQRFVVARQLPKADSLVFSAIGSGFSYYGPQWAEASLGLPIDAQPDAIYGAWVAESYRKAIQMGEPLVHDVDALIKPQSGSRARLRIRRVVLPFKQPTGENFVVGGSFYDDAVDLRRIVEVGTRADADDELAYRLRTAHRKMGGLRAG